MFETENQLTIADEEGNEHLVEIIYEWEHDGKSYVIVHPVGAAEDEEEEQEVTAFRFEVNEADEEITFLPIETEEEWEMVDNVLAELDFEDADEE